MFYLVDKPVGPSSNQILAHLKKYFHIKSAGHSGTLDPLASGLLIVATGNSTKLLPLVTTGPKIYEFTFDITQSSESLDLGTPLCTIVGDSQPLREALKKGVSLSGVSLKNILQQFVGSLSQIPPRYSAIWVNGKRSYRQARDHTGDEPLAPLPSRSVTVHSLELLSIDFPRVQMRASVSEGTYIRSLARDIGAALGGAGVITELRRTTIGHLSLKKNSEPAWESIESYLGEITTLRVIQEGDLLPHIKNITVSLNELATLRRGNPVFLSPLPEGIKYNKIILANEEVLVSHEWNIYALAQHRWDQLFPKKFWVGHQLHLQAQI